MSDYVQIQAIAIKALSLSSSRHISRWLHTAELEHLADLEWNLLHSRFHPINAFDLANLSAYIDGYGHISSSLFDLCRWRTSSIISDVVAF